jgi:hypothetical protein
VLLGVKRLGGGSVYRDRVNICQIIWCSVCPDLIFNV